MTTAIYARVSTSKQTTDNQVEQLKDVAKKAGWEVSQVYEEVLSGAKRREARPELDALLRAVTRREVRRVMVWDVSRLGRSLQDLVSTMNEIHEAGADLYLHQQAIDTATPSGRALFQMCGVFAEFERSMISERVSAGLERARTAGKILGRPGTAPIKRKQVLALKQENPQFSIRKLAEAVNLSPSMVHKILKQSV
jgi:DNA invertase Pin-like site-specific DNA recombinase